MGFWKNMSDIGKAIDAAIAAALAPTLRAKDKAGI